MLTGLTYVCVCVCVCVGTVNGVFISKTQKGKRLCDLKREAGRVSLHSCLRQVLKLKKVSSAQLGSRKTVLYVEPKSLEENETTRKIKLAKYETTYKET